MPSWSKSLSWQKKPVILRIGPTAIPVKTFGVSLRRLSRPEKSGRSTGGMRKKGEPSPKGSGIRWDAGKMLLYRQLSLKLQL
jgi:hypothetical protein